jgi:hypothetical protein
MTSLEQTNPEENAEVDLNEEEISEFEFATTTASEYIAASFYALEAVDGMDTAIMSKEDERRINRIKRKSLRIIDQCISDLYDEIFDEEEEKPQP